MAAAPADGETDGYKNQGRPTRSPVFKCMFTLCADRGFQPNLVRIRLDVLRPKDINRGFSQIHTDSVSLLPTHGRPGSHALSDKELLIRAHPRKSAVKIFLVLPTSSKNTISGKCMFNCLNPAFQLV